MLKDFSSAILYMFLAKTVPTLKLNDLDQLLPLVSMSKTQTILVNHNSSLFFKPKFTVG
jgi:hypothetical protein